MRARQLAAQNVFREQDGVAAFGFRSRRIVINTNLLPLTKAPHSLQELTNQAWRGKVALAYPQFGTTSAHFHALRQYWGSINWETWCDALAANKPQLVDGNSVVVKTVGRGDALVGLTDSDDIAAGQEEGQPIAPLPLTPESLLIPNTIAVVRNCRHPDEAQRLFEYLRQPAVTERLIAAKALEGAPSGNATLPLKINWDRLLADLNTTTETLNKIFLR